MSSLLCISVISFAMCLLIIISVLLFLQIAIEFLRVLNAAAGPDLYLRIGYKISVEFNRRIRALTHIKEEQRALIHVNRRNRELM